MYSNHDQGKLGEVAVEFMLDSGSSVSLIQYDLLKSVTRVNAFKALQLVTASGDSLPILQHVKALVQLGELNIFHEFVVVNGPVTPVILGLTFLQENGLTLDFSQTPVAVCSGHAKHSSSSNSIAVAQVLPIYKAAQANLNYTCVLPVDSEIQNDVVDECAVPSYNGSPKMELPKCAKPQYFVQYLVKQMKGITSFLQQVIQ